MANAPSLTVGLCPAPPNVKGKTASGFLGGIGCYFGVFHTPGSRSLTNMIELSCAKLPFRAQRNAPVCRTWATAGAHSQEDLEGFQIKN